MTDQVREREREIPTYIVKFLHCQSYSAGIQSTITEQKHTHSSTIIIIPTIYISPSKPDYATSGGGEDTVVTVSPNTCNIDIARAYVKQCEIQQQGLCMHVHVYMGVNRFNNVHVHVVHYTRTCSTSYTSQLTSGNN